MTIVDTLPSPPWRLAEPGAWLTAVVENSDDAIVSKTLDGVIQSWNAGAERVFGFTRAEAVGSHITLIIPQDRLGEEDDIITRVRRGERIELFETVRQRKDGELIDVSVTVSPVRDDAGAILGASKIARDISETKRASERQSLLLREMHHRIKNLFAMVAGLITVSARDAATVTDLAVDLNGRLLSLSRAHALTMPDLAGNPTEERATGLKSLLAALVVPHERAAKAIVIEGEDFDIGAQALPMTALLLHELTTNAVKYGALSHPQGMLRVAISRHHTLVEVVWTETGGSVQAGERSEGFGSLLERATVKSLGATLDRAWSDGGVVVTLRVPDARLQA